MPVLALLLGAVLLLAAPFAAADDPSPPGTRYRVQCRGLGLSLLVPAGWTAETEGAVWRRGEALLLNLEPGPPDTTAQRAAELLLASVREQQGVDESAIEPLPAADGAPAGADVVLRGTAPAGAWWQRTRVLDSEPVVQALHARLAPLDDGDLPAVQAELAPTFASFRAWLGVGGQSRPACELPVGRLELGDAGPWARYLGLWDRPERRGAGRRAGRLELAWHTADGASAAGVARAAAERAAAEVGATLGGDGVTVERDAALPADAAGHVVELTVVREPAVESELIRRLQRQVRWHRTQVVQRGGHLVELAATVDLPTRDTDAALAEARRAVDALFAGFEVTAR